MRTLECLVHQYPDKTGKELLKIQEQDKLEDQKEFQEIHQSKVDFVNDVKKNGGYYKGKFGLDQRFMYHITDIFLEDDGTVYVDVEKIVIFLGSDKGVVAENNFHWEKKTQVNRDASKYGFDLYTRITEVEWNELISYINGVDKFWQTEK